MADISGHVGGVVRSALFTTVFALGSAGYVLSAFVASRRDAAALRRVAHGWARFHGVATRRLLGVRSRVEGAFPAGPVIIAAKHQSMYETVELLAMLGEPAVVMKRELTEIPGWGRVARMHGVIPVDRAGSAAALKAMLRAGRAAVADGRSILIFPEGTRVAPGETPPLRAGFAGLYKMLGLPVVPVALDSGRLWRRGAFVKRKGVVTIRIGQTIPPGLPREEIEARVHAGINALERDEAARLPADRP